VAARKTDGNVLLGSKEINMKRFINAKTAVLGAVAMALVLMAAGHGQAQYSSNELTLPGGVWVTKAQEADGSTSYYSLMFSADGRFLAATMNAEFKVTGGFKGTYTFSGSSLNLNAENGKAIVIEIVKVDDNKFMSTTGKQPAVWVRVTK
jgi:hypothetical protein